MKKTIITLCSLFLIFSCTEKKPEGNLHLTGNIQGLSKGTIYIKKVVDTALVAIDTIKINGDSHFESWLTVDSPEMYYLYLDRGMTNSLDDNLPFFAEPGNMNIETNLDQYFAKAKITGSENQKLFEEYKKINRRYIDQRLDLTEAALRASKTKNPARLDSIEKLKNSIMRRKYLFAVNFAINNKDHEISPYIALAEINDVNLKLMDTIQKSMTPKVARSYYGKKLIKYYNERKKLEE